MRSQLSTTPTSGIPLPLTVAQLVALLRELPQDLPVVVAAYESGWDPVVPELVSVRELRRLDYIGSWEGPYTEHWPVGSPEPLLSAVCIGRDR